MAEKTLTFGNIRVNKKEFLKSKQPIDLISVNIGQIVVSVTSNISKNVERICPFLLEIMMCWISTKNFGMRLKIN